MSTSLDPSPNNPPLSPHLPPSPPPPSPPSQCPPPPRLGLSLPPASMFYSTNVWLRFYWITKLWKAKSFILCGGAEAAEEIWHWSLLKTCSLPWAARSWTKKGKRSGVQIGGLSWEGPCRSTRSGASLLCCSFRFSWWLEKAKEFGEYSVQLIFFPFPRLPYH